MAKIIDITDKLNFDENPKLVIKGKEFEVKADAETVLKIMGILGSGEGSSAKGIVDAYNLMFSEKDREEINNLNLQFNDFTKVVECAIDLIVDGDDDQGER